MSDTIQVPALARELELGEFEIRADGDQVRLSMTASSEYPVERFFGTEVLVHEPGAIRLERANRGALPLLFNHDDGDVVGMIDGLRLEGKKLRADARMFDSPRAREVEAMVRGGLRNVSIRYRLHRVEEDPKKSLSRVTEWEPLEVSIVTIPADPTVGIGRSASGPNFEVRMIRASKPPADPANTTEKAGMTEVSTPAPAESAQGNQEPRVEVRSNGPNAVEMEKRRKQSIENLCRMNNLDEKYRDFFIGSGASVDEVGDQILSILEERGRTNPQPASKIGLSRNEAQRFSLARAIVAAATQDWKHAGFELEAIRATQDKLGRAPEPHRFVVPFEILERQFGPRELSRDANVATPGQGGYLVATDNLGFIEILRNRSVAFRMGARRLSGLSGNVTVPRQSAAATAYWLASETTQIQESQQTFVQMALTPKTVGAYTEISRQLLLQSSPAAEGIVTDDLAQVVATAADLAALSGSGSAGQPTGLANTGGIGSVTGTSIDYAKVLEFQTDVAAANVVPVSGGYVTTPAVAALLMQRSRFSNTDTPLWTGNVWDGQVSGFRAMTSQQVAAATMYFGDWSEMVIAEWGVLEVETNPYANFQAGIIGVRAMYSLDIGIRRPFAFSAASSIT